MPRATQPWRACGGDLLCIFLFVGLFVLTKKRRTRTCLLWVGGVWVRGCGVAGGLRGQFDFPSLYFLFISLITYFHFHSYVYSVIK